MQASGLLKTKHEMAKYVRGLLLKSIVPIVAALALAGCVTRYKPAPVPVAALEPPTKADLWQRVASAGDVERIKRVGSAWTSALADARARGFRGDMTEEGDLLKANAALPRPAPTPGSYACRLVRVGRTTSKVKALERFKPFFCYVEAEGEQLTIVKQTGSQRPIGRLWEDDDGKRLIFLGSLTLANEDQPLAYGENAKRDMAGVLERIAPFRWRLVIPWPQAQSKLDVYELTPVPEQPKTA
jgi:hypothetical protein